MAGCAGGFVATTGGGAAGAGALVVTTGSGSTAGTTAGFVTTGAAGAVVVSTRAAAEVEGTTSTRAAAEVEGEELPMTANTMVLTNRVTIPRARPMIGLALFVALERAMALKVMAGTPM